MLQLTKYFMFLNYSCSFSSVLYRQIVYIDKLIFLNVLLPVRQRSNACLLLHDMRVSDCWL